MLGIIVVVLVAAAVLLCVALTTPIDFDVAAKRDPTFQINLRVAWLYGLVSTKIEPESETKPSPPAREPKPSAPARGGASKFVRVVRSKGFLPGVVRLLRRLVTGTEIRRAELWARAGFDDPADTGRFLGIWFPLSRFLLPSSRYAIRLEPDFLEAVLVFEARTVLRVVPIRIVGPALAFALSPTTLRALWVARG